MLSLRIIRTLTLAAATLGSLAACSRKADESPAPAVQATRINNLFAANDSLDRSGGVPPFPIALYRPWRFFSLRTGAEVPRADSNSTRWDIAFKGTTIRVNAGTSGPGTAAAVVQTGSFEAITTAPADASFRQDNSVAPAVSDQLAIISGSGNGWYNYNGMTMVISPIPGRVIAVRTADGRFGKVEILSYYQNAPSTVNPLVNRDGYYTFRFTLGAAGTRNLQ
jgi:hypothetical protein